MRAGTYVWHRLTRLPDPPHRIARGIFAGVFISFTPLFGLHFFASALMAFLMRGNMVAAIFATFFGNPITFPIIAVSSVQLGHWILGTGVDAVPARLILSAFANASGEIWTNFVAMFTDSPTQWGQLRHFYYGLFKPYLVGGIAPGLVAATVCYYVSLPIILGYQKLRQKRRRDRAESLRERAAARLRGRNQADDGASGGP
nr:DUF2062 domain-containing protein [Pseudotabrizicola algicola]